jgi:hypothetical protein
MCVRMSGGSRRITPLALRWDDDDDDDDDDDNDDDGTSGGVVDGRLLFVTHFVKETLWVVIASRGRKPRLLVSADSMMATDKAPQLG